MTYSYAAIPILLPLLACAPLISEPHSRQGWGITFDYSEVAPNPGAGAPMTRLAMSIQSDGQFRASRFVDHPDGRPAEEDHEQGMLTSEQLEEIATYLLNQNIGELGATHLSLPGGSGTEDGWGGQVGFREADGFVSFTFDSRGVFPTDPRQQAQQRWGLALVQYLETAARQLATGSELPPGRALTEAEAVRRALAAMEMKPEAAVERFLRAMQIREMETGRATWVVSYSSPIGGPNWSVTLDALSGRVLTARRLPGR